MQLTINNIKSIPTAAETIISIIGDRKLVAFKGEMGAGKTTLIKEICRQFGVDDATNSPSFSIVNEYYTANGEVIYHFDFYRLNEPQEALDLGVEDYFDSGSLCLMEWPEMIGDLLPEDTMMIEVCLAEDDSRLIRIAE